MSLLAPNNRALIVAMDHSRTLGVVPGLEDPAQVIEAAIEAGAAGVVFGRNIWQSGHTAGMIAALKHIIHHNGSVSEAMQKLSRDSVQIHN